MTKMNKSASQVFQKIYYLSIQTLLIIDIFIWFIMQQISNVHPYGVITACNTECNKDICTLSQKKSHISLENQHFSKTQSQRNRKGDMRVFETRTVIFVTFCTDEIHQAEFI